jgi:tRNA dimethylallyltransferase
VAQFRAHALGALEELGGRGGIGILAGGTGFWLRAVTAGIDTDALPSDPERRASLEADLEREGVEPMAARLASVAPNLAARTDLRNPRRVVRAMEIADLRGDAPLPAARGYPSPILGIQLVVEPAEHRRRIAARARAQFAAGLVEEAQALRERWDPSLRAFSAIGYHESWAYLDGALTFEEAIELDAQRNRQFAKRQATWFRREPALEILDATGDPRPGASRYVRDFAERVRDSGTNRRPREG